MPTARDNRTVIVAAEGTTEPVAIASGLCQGCPLSGLLFNLVVDPVIRGVQGDGDAHNILAHADDLTPLADSPAQLQDRINIVETLASPLGLALNPAKCSSLHICGATPVGMRPTTSTVSGVPIQPLQDNQPQRFLGRPLGFRLPSRTGSAIDDAIAHASAIFSSMLAPWERIDAVKTFIYPALNFAMRCGVFTNTDWRRLDKVVRPLVKRTLYLPGNASTHYIYGTAASGAVAIPVAAELHDICRVDSAFKLLTTADRDLRDMALADAYAVASAGRRLGRSSRPTSPETSREPSAPPRRSYGRCGPRRVRLPAACTWLGPLLRTAPPSPALTSPSRRRTVAASCGRSARSWRPTGTAPCRPSRTRAR
ncbi:hypothetical protein MTO96_034303 [Rhipicephalus appendiculatus]